MNGKMQDILSRFKRRGSKAPSSPITKQEQFEDWPIAGGLLISGDYLPMIQQFKDLFENSAAMQHFMSFLDSLGKQHLLKFWIHVEGFKSCTDCKELKTDATHIYINYIAPNSQFYLNLPDKIQNDIDNALNSDANLIDNLDCFNEAQNFIWNLLKTDLFNDFLDSPYYCMHKIEVYKIGSLQLIDILHDRQLLTLFADFMELEGRINLLEFILAVENFNQASTSKESSLNVENAMQIYNRFFQVGAEHSLNFDPTIRNEIEENICSKNGAPSLDTFERARQAASAILETRFITLFVKSKAFNEHIYALNCYVDSKVGRPEAITKSRTRESISSLQSHSQSDMNELSSEKRSSTFDEDRISQCSSAYSSEICKRAGSLARIDLLGRYESLFDSSLCSNTDLQSNRSGLKNMLNRYVKAPIVHEDAQSYEEAMKIVENIKRMVSRSQSNGSNITLNN